MTDSPGTGQLSDRKAREAEFHDDRYSDDARRALKRFYRATEDSRDRFHQLLGTIPSGSRVLELGCGVSALSYELTEQGCRCTAIDISPEAVRQTQTMASKRKLNVETVIGDAEATGLPGHTFDYVVGNGIIHHLDLPSVAHEVDRLLTPGGRALFVEPLGVNPLINMFRDRTPTMRTPDEHPLVASDIDVLGYGQTFDVDVEFFTLTQLAIPLLERSVGRELEVDWARRATRWADKLLLDQRSPLRWMGWMAVITVTRSGQVDLR